MSLKIRVLLADDHPAFRRGIAYSLVACHDMEVVGEARTGTELLAQVVSLCPDVILLDLRMPDTSPFTLVSELHRLVPKVRVLILSGYDEDAYITGMLQQRVAGYLLKDESPDTVIDAIRAVARGERRFSTSIASQIADLAFPTDNNQRNRPTEREMTVLHCLTRGSTDAQIANELGISERTVRYHIANLFTRLQVNSRVEVVVEAIRRQWVSLQTP